MVRGTSKRERSADRDPVDAFYAPHVNIDKNVHALHQNIEQEVHDSPLIP